MLCSPQCHYREREQKLGLLGPLRGISKQKLHRGCALD